MHFDVRPFRRLQWQLSLSYTLVAAGALLVVELILIGALLVVMNSNMLPRLMVQAFRDQFSVNLRPFLDQPEPDIQAIGSFLSAYMQETAKASQQGRDLQIWSSSESSDNFFLLDPQGRLLWTQVQLGDTRVFDPLDLSRVPGLEQVFPAAASNQRDPDRLFTRTGDLVTIAVPMLTQDGQRVLGVMVVLLRMPSITNPQFLSQLLPTVLVSLLVFTFSAGLVGSVFGYFTARRLTRRLGRVSLAADAWSRGDFTNFIPDSAGDELGELSRRLNAMAEQLQNLMYTRQELAAVEERNRIARELHDSVKQQVFATAMQLGALRAILPEETGPLSQRLEEAERLTRQAQAELTTLIRELRPVALESKGLVRALRELTGDFTRQTGIQTRFECPNESHGAIHLPLLKEQALFRVTQEALSNIARHSQAGHVRLCLRREHGLVNLVIQDDGHGFDLSNPGSKDTGLGLRSMRERVEAQQGTFTIESSPGEGTKLAITLPE